jgi:hypothetical protein
MRGQCGGLFPCDGRGGCRFCSFLALSLEGLAFDVAHFLFKSALEVRGSLAELGHQFAQTASQFGQLMRPEDDQNNDKQNYHVGHAEHGDRWPQDGLLAS